MWKAPPLVLALSVLAVVRPVAVQAQDSPMEQGIAHFEAGEFDDAREAFERALWQTELSPTQFRELLVHRATLAIAEADEETANEDLLRLASLDPEYSFDRSIPPQVREAFERAVERVARPLALRVRHDESDGGVELSARVVSDISGLVTDVRLFARVGDGEYDGGASSLSLETNDGDLVSYYAEAAGPGGSIVVREGTARTPRSFNVGGPLDDDQVDDGGVGAGVWVTIIVVGALAIAGGVVAAVLLTADGDTTVQPMIRF